jgi:uncharacterized protein DUF1844
MTEEAPPRDQSGDEPAEGAGGRAIPLEAVPTRELLVWMIGVLGAKAWQGMGLVPNPASGKIEKNLEDAKIAIDAFSALLDAMRPQLDAQLRRESEALLTTLRVNFVEKNAGS